MNFWIHLSVLGITNKPDVVQWGKGSGRVTSIDKKQTPPTFRREDINKLLLSLWESNASSSRLFDDIIPLLKEDKDPSGICLLLSSVKDLPERWLADLLNYSFDESVTREWSVTSRMLEILLSTSYSDVVLLNHLRRKLTTHSTIRLLEYLKELLQNCRLSSSDGPDLSQIVDWISLILDAHHNELLIAGSNDQVKHLIAQLDQLIAESVRSLFCLIWSIRLISNSIAYDLGTFLVRLS